MAMIMAIYVILSHLRARITVEEVSIRVILVAVKMVVTMMVLMIFPTIQDSHGQEW